jgi:plasmid segregation protein ParM
MTMNNKPYTTVGLDIGYGHCKAVSENGQQVCFESKVAPAEFIRFKADIGAPVKIKGLTLYNTEDGDLFIGELAARQGRPGTVRSPRDRNRVADPITMHLAHAAFAMLFHNLPYTRLRIVTGLPVDYFRDAAELANFLRGLHTIYLDGHSLVVDVDEVLVVPQPFGALLSVLLDGQARFRTDQVDLIEGQVGVLDIGMFTTDLILVDGLEYIEARSGSVEVGVSTAIDMLRKVLLDDYRVTYEAHEIEVAMRRGWLVIDGEKQPLNGLGSQHLDPIARAIDSKVRTLWNISALSAIVLAGGGSLALKPWLEPHFKQAIYAPDAAMANAKGFLRYGLRQWR